eukprot:59122-Chlamydomonas_euryale.AAC.1
MGGQTVRGFVPRWMGGQTVRGFVPHWMGGQTDAAEDRLGGGSAFLLYFLNGCGMHEVGWMGAA